MSPILFLDTIDSEREIASGDVTTPRQIQEAALGITQAALKANSAAASGRKLADISVAGEVIHKAANDLVRRLRCGTRAVMASVRKSSTGDLGQTDPERATCIKACTRAIEGGKATLQELVVMVDNMIKVGISRVANYMQSFGYATFLGIQIIFIF